MTGCSSAAAAATTSFGNLLSSSYASRRPLNFLCTASETQTGVVRFIGCNGGDFTSSCRYLSPLVCVRRNLVRSLPSSLTQSSQVESEPQIEDRRPRLSNEDNLRTVGIKIQLCKECKFGEQFFIVGAQPDLGLWNPLDAVPMTWSDDHLWTAELDIPLGEPVQFKFILREITGNFLWQPGKDRVLHTWETCNIISVIEDWEVVEAQQVNEEPVVNNECKEQLKHLDEKYNDEESCESLQFASSAVCSNHEIVATAANYISDHSITDMESTAEICGNLVVDENLTSHAISESGLIGEDEVNVELGSSNIVSDIKVETTIEEQVNGFRELEKVNGISLTFNAELSDLKVDNDEDAYRHPERQNNEGSDLWRDEIKWGQTTLKRFLNNFGFL